MKNIFLPKVTMCIIALLALILPVSAQNTNVTDEYKETLKKIMDFSGTSTTTDDFFQKLSSIMKLNAPKKDEAYWNEFSKNWKEKVENKVFEMYMPVYEKHLTLAELKAVAAFYESPVGKKYKEASLMVMRGQDAARGRNQRAGRPQPEHGHIRPVFPRSHRGRGKHRAGRQCCFPQAAGKRLICNTLFNTQLLPTFLYSAQNDTRFKIKIALARG